MLRPAAAATLTLPFPSLSVHYGTMASSKNPCATIRWLTPHPAQASTDDSPVDATISRLASHKSTPSPRLTPLSLRPLTAPLRRRPRSAYPLPRRHRPPRLGPPLRTPRDAPRAFHRPHARSSGGLHCSGYHRRRRAKRRDRRRGGGRAGERGGEAVRRERGEDGRGGWGGDQECGRGRREFDTSVPRLSELRADSTVSRTTCGCCGSGRGSTS